MLQGEKVHFFSPISPTSRLQYQELNDVRVCSDNSNELPRCGTRRETDA